jgi:hypothetical protein
MSAHNQSMLLDHADQDEKRRVLENDASLRTAGTFFSHTHSDGDLGGRFAAVGAQTIVGQSPNPYPPMPPNNPWARDPVPPEEPLGFSINEFEPSSCTSPVQATGDPMPDGDAPSPIPLGDVQRADVGSPSLGNSVPPTNAEDGNA